MAFVEPESFDLYFVLVETLFGNILTSGFAVVLAMVLIAILMKMSPLLQIFLIGTFIFAFGIGYAGALVALPAFIGGAIYLIAGILNTFKKVTDSSS